VALNEPTARALAAIERLDRAAAATALDECASLNLTWSLFADYAQACYGLLWGDREDALHNLHRDRGRSQPWLDAGSTAAGLFDAVEAELLMALGRAGQAGTLLESAADHPVLTAARTHFALLTGEDQHAVQLAERALVRPDQRRPRMELRLVAALAQARLGLREQARTSLRHAAEGAHATGALRAFALVPAGELAELATEVPEASALLQAEPLRSRTAVFPDRLATIELTERERTILSLIEDGLNMQQMAAELYVSYNTIKTHMRGLYQKVDASSREQALANAYRLGLVPAVSTSS